MEVIYFALGALLLALVYWDLFESIVVPRPTPGRFRIGRYVLRYSWRLVRKVGRGRDGRRRETLLGLYAPAATVVLLLVWMAVLIAGYGLVLFAVRDELRPVPPDLGAAIYSAATTVLTLGGDAAATGPLARAAVVLSAASGLGVVALVITFLFSLYGSYQRREVQVVTLQAAAGAPPSAVALLEDYARLELTARLPQLFIDWESWAAEVLDSHVAYPLLGYFRSSHDNLSWIGALGTVLDAACIVLTTIERVPRGEAELCRRVGVHLAEDIFNLGYRIGPSGPVTPKDAAQGLDRSTFDAACARLAAAGYELVPAARAWPAFAALRATYSPRLESMAAYWAMSSSSWLGTDEALRSAVHRD
jgi:hypothetical protein